jgi:hypothetical protein
MSQSCRLAAILSADRRGIFAGDGNPGLARYGNDSLRRILVIAGWCGEGSLTEPTAARRCGPPFWLQPLAQPGAEVRFVPPVIGAAPRPGRAESRCRDF